MKHLVFAVVLSGFAFAASAHVSEDETAAPRIKIIEAVTVTGEAPVTKDDQRPVADIIKKPDISCIQQTGSRVRAKNQSGSCNGEHGRVYTHENLGSGGRINLAGSLSTVDVAIATD